MTVKVYKYSKRMRSTGVPGSSVTQDMFIVTLKEPTDVLNPVFIFSSTNWAGVGYNYISAVLGDKERFYRVTDVIHVNADHYEVHATEDVLATWRSDIKNSTQYVLRSDDSSLYDHGSNEAYIDTAYPSYGTVQGVKHYTGIFNTSNGYYVLGVIGDNIYTSLERGPVKYIVLRPSQLDTLMGILNSLTYSAADYNPLQYIVSCTFIPLTFSTNDFTSHSSTWTLGSYSVGPISYYSLTTTNADGVNQVKLDNIDFPDHMNISRGLGYNQSPWINYHFYAGPFGDFDIPTDLLPVAQNRQGTFEVALDFCTGEGHLEIFYGGRPIIEMNTQIGVPVMLSQITSNSLRAQYEVASHLASSVSAAANFNLGNSAQEMGAAVITSYEASIPKLSSVGSNGSMAALYDDDFHLVTKHSIPGTEDLTRFGRPVMESFSLSSVSSGKYIRCADARISIPAYETEINEIEQRLNEGIYLD